MPPGIVQTTHAVNSEVLLKPRKTDEEGEREDYKEIEGRPQADLADG